MIFEIIGIILLVIGITIILKREPKQNGKA